VEKRAGVIEAPAETTWTGYSLAERDRRWEAVRAGAAAAGLDCLFVPLGNGLDARYLTQMRNAVIVLPTDGRAPVVVAGVGAASAWMPEPRRADREWAVPMAEALLEAGMERGRIGVAGLRGGQVSHVRAVDGVVNHTSYAEVRRRLPNATFEDATDVVGFVRYVKSAEEIECLRRGVAIADAGIAEMIAIARPGVDAAVLYGRVMRRMLALGSEYYYLALFIGPRDGPARRHISPPIGRRLEPDMLITNETRAVWGGLNAQEDQPILLGPMPEAWKPVIALHREVFEAGLAAIKPGLPLPDLMDLVNGFGSRRGMATRISLLGRGLGDDGPILTPRSHHDQARGLSIERGSAFIWKPIARSADGAIQFQWGATVVVTERGAEVLSPRPHGLVSIT
jgi:Xaa-Pro dipeptidase